MPSIDTTRQWGAHRFSELLPRMSAAGLARLVDDIRTNGVLVPVTIFEGKILDGRNRLEAARVLQIERIPAIEFAGDASAAQRHVVSLNLSRRQLGTGQAAMSAALLRAQSPVPLTQTEAAAMCGVSDRYLRIAEQLREHDSPQAPELVQRVHAGTLGLRAALRIANNEPQRERNRAPLIDSMPDNPAIAAPPTMALDSHALITQAAHAIVAAGADPTAWVRLQDIAPGERYVLATAIEEFGRRAADILAEEIGAPNPDAAAQRVAQRGGSAAQQALARADALGARPR